MKVSNIALGTDNYGNQYGCDETTAHEILSTALDGGINFVDTSDSYNEGRSESMIGNYLTDSGRRNNVVLATKYRSPVGPGVNDLGASRYHIVRAVEESLRRLRTDRIDLLYCHSWDAETPIEETLRAVDDLIHQGKVVYAAASNFPTWVLAKGLWTSDVRNLYRFEAIQSVFNILQPGLGREMVPFAADHDVAVIPYSPLASGMLTGQHGKSGKAVAGSKFDMRDDSKGGGLKSRYFNEATFTAVEKFTAIAEKNGQPAIRLALQWVSEFPGVTAPIFGARKVEHIKGVLSAWSESAPTEVMSEVRAVADEFEAQAPMAYPPKSGQAFGTLPTSSAAK
ncbi:MAG: aldo/keto reductase [Dehalococcoidia bacterium]|nr:aldo/keto reductase [Dehalococcoidia bacterium]